MGAEPQVFAHFEDADKTKTALETLSGWRFAVCHVLGGYIVAYAPTDAPNAPGQPVRLDG